jgi:hypothetical protein
LQRKLPFEKVRSQISNLRMNLLDIAGGSDNSRGREARLRETKLILEKFGK